MSSRFRQYFITFFDILLILQCYMNIAQLLYQVGIKMIKFQFNT